MDAYQAMYAVLFRKITAVIEELQIAQRQTEEMYISAEPLELSILDRMKPEEGASGSGDKTPDKDK